MTTRVAIDRDLEDLLARYLHHLGRRGLSPRTLTSYGHQIRAYLRDVDYRTSTTAVIEAWLDSRRGQHGRPDLVARSRCCYVASIGGFHKWLTENGVRTDDPTLRLVRPKVVKGLPRPIAPADLERALAEAPPMLKAWISLAAFAGLRCAEIADLTVEDIDQSAVPPVLRLRKTKGSKPRTVPLSAAALAALVAYGLPQAGPVFRDGLGRPFVPYEVTRQGARYLRSQGIDATMHQARHSFASELYRETRDLLLVSHLLGHSRADTTQTYAQVVVDDRAHQAVEALSAGRPAGRPLASRPAPSVAASAELREVEALRAVRAVADALGVVIVEMYLDDGLEHGVDCECCMRFDSPDYPIREALDRGEIPWTYENAARAGVGSKEELLALGIRLAR